MVRPITLLGTLVLVAGSLSAPVSPALRPSKIASASSVKATSSPVPVVGDQNIADVLEETARDWEDYWWCDWIWLPGCYGTLPDWTRHQRRAPGSVSNHWKNKTALLSRYQEDGDLTLDDDWFWHVVNLPDAKPILGPGDKASLKSGLAIETQATLQGTHLRSEIPHDIRELLCEYFPQMPWCMLPGPTIDVWPSAGPARRQYRDLRNNAPVNPSELEIEAQIATNPHTVPHGIRELICEHFPQIWWCRHWDLAAPLFTGRVDVELANDGGLKPGEIPTIAGLKPGGVPRNPVGSSKRCPAGYIIPCGETCCTGYERCADFTCVDDPDVATPW